MRTTEGSNNQRERSTWLAHLAERADSRRQGREFEPHLWSRDYIKRNKILKKKLEGQKLPLGLGKTYLVIVQAPYLLPRSFQLLGDNTPPSNSSFFLYIHCTKTSLILLQTNYSILLRNDGGKNKIVIIRRITNA